MSTDVIPRLNTALEGRYRLERELGQGGMATVYLAEDIRHQRKVAIKVLRPDLAAVVGAERFLAEIRTTANLQHPHILPLHDSGEADGFLFFVTPYVEGETLRDRLDREKQLPVDDAVAISVAIASALEAAHEQGVVHRDIKPANILLSRGQPLVADFGVALAVTEAGGSRLTETGLSVGTPYYMSPEQATGDREIGPRSDVYALGCMLYEMLVGDPPHVGSTAQAVLGKILTEAPKAPTTVRPAVPRNVEAAVLKSLEKLPADRFGSAADFARALGDASFRYGDAEVAGAGPVVGPGLWRPAALIMTAVAIAAVSFAALRDEPRAPPIHVELPLPEGLAMVIGGGMNMDVSPDGSAVAFVASQGGATPMVWIRRLDGLSPSALRGSEAGSTPRFSPDGSAVAFVASGDLKTVGMNGAPPLTLVEDSVGAGGGGLSWGRDGYIYYEHFTGFRRVPAGGGPQEPICTDATRRDVAWMDALPGGKGLIFTRTPTGNIPDASEVEALSLESCEMTTLVHGTMGRFAPPDQLVFATATGQVLALPFDPRTLRTIGAPKPLLEGIQVNTGSASYFAASESGALVYARGGSGGWAVATWVDEEGGETPLPGDTGGAVDSPAISPDGKRVAFVYSPSGATHPTIWVLDLQDGTFAPLSFDGDDDHPFWSPDGAWVGFTRWRQNLTLWAAPSDFSGQARQLLPSDLGASARAQWMPDGRSLVVRDRSQGAARIGVVSLDSAAVPTFLSEGFPVGDISLSPDGRWVAFESDVSGRNEVYVVPTPGPGGRRQVSVAGGANPRWSPTGDRLFYQTRELDWWYATVRTDPTFAVVERTRFGSAVPYVGDYAVAPDGKRLLAFRRTEGLSGEKMLPRLVTDWRALLLGEAGGRRASPRAR